MTYIFNIKAEAVNHFIVKEHYDVYFTTKNEWVCTCLHGSIHVGKECKHIKAVRKLVQVMKWEVKE